MKASIVITGQIQSNFTLVRAFSSGYFIEKHDTMFNGFELVFPSRKIAKKALWEAYKHLRRTDPDRSQSTLSYSPGWRIFWDASVAQLEERKGKQ